MRRGGGRRVNALITPVVTLGFDEIGQVLAPDGRIKSFSSDADGYTRSEGGGMLVLKRVDDARRDGDQILAVIAGSAVNHDGRSNGLIAPNQDAQADVLRRAYKDAGIDPRTVDYVEAHGTGTVLGDPIEAEALGRVVGKGRPADRPALLGAVKTNVGHLESAAGAASMAKVVLALQHDKLPPSINFAGPSPYIDFDAMRLKVIDTVTDWPRYGGYAVAGCRASASAAPTRTWSCVRSCRVTWWRRRRGNPSPSRRRPPRWHRPMRPRWKATRCGSTTSAISSPTPPREVARPKTKSPNCRASPKKRCGSSRPRWKSLRHKRLARL
ncbi:beta-ketoacyl synthase, C-terminal domain protein [Mycobacterium kansasii]|uniref:Beta-ketoacyl synthase, C-terminal domain protein n=1 Tax=Mycobacterium kansasii TaxID=1768 RepID=A0A1V3X109_MYCKA|nr:beta-ketoacyl synthase, C-terminal domain protein [Mycobacterium kansasii]